MSLPAVCCAKGRWETWVLALKTKDRNAIIKDRELTKEVRPFDVRHCNRSYHGFFHWRVFCATVCVPFTTIGKTLRLVKNLMFPY